MARFDKIRYRYLYSEFASKRDRDLHTFKFDAPKPLVQKHPHTCIAVRVDAEAREIHYAIARRESPGKLISLKSRINKIRELGGIVPEYMTQAVNRYSHDFSKKGARRVACLKLNSNPHVISNVDISTLNAHVITRLVMESLVADESFGNYSPTVSTAAESAADWLMKNVEEYRDTLPNLHVAKDFLSMLDEVASSIFVDTETEVPFGYIDEEQAKKIMALGPNFLPVLPKKATPA